MKFSIKKYSELRMQFFMFFWVEKHVSGIRFAIRENPDFSSAKRTWSQFLTESELSP